MKKNFFLFCLALFLSAENTYTQTWWKGTTSADWSAASNRTAGRLTVNAGSTLTLAGNITVNTDVSVSGTLHPAASHAVSGAGALIVNAGGALVVKAGDHAANYSLSGAVALNGTNPVFDNSDILLKGNKNDKFSVLLRNIFGRECYFKKIMAAGNEEIITVLPSQKLAAGVYLVTAYANDGKIYSEKVIIG